MPDHDQGTVSCTETVKTISADFILIGEIIVKNEHDFDWSRGIPISPKKVKLGIPPLGLGVNSSPDRK